MRLIAAPLSIGVMMFGMFVLGIRPTIAETVLVAVATVVACVVGDL